MSPTAVGGVSSALTLCTLLLVPLTFVPKLLIKETEYTAKVRKAEMLKKMKDGLSFDNSMLKLACNLLENATQQLENSSQKKHLEDSVEKLTTAASDGDTIFLPRGPMRLKKPIVGANTINTVFLELGEFVHVFSQAHLQDKELRNFALTKLNALKEARPVKRMVGLSYVVQTLQEL